MKTVLFIPIKLNNQRLPGKNLMDLEGRPLCDYLFQTVRNLDCVDEKYVYCSDETIIPYIPKEFKFLKRPRWLDGFEIKGLDIIEQFVRDVDADVYILTHVTQPFIKKESFEKALNAIVGDRYDSAFSVIECQDYFWKDGKPLNYNPANIVRTQDLDPIYMETSGFFMFKKEVFTKYHRRIGFNPYMQPVDQYEAIDIDTREDFEMAKIVARYLKSKSSTEN